jgi:mannose-1-phosphate guanylyltransferase
MIPVKPVILCGGSGTRLWPLSDKQNPKQFIEINGISFLEKTIQRIRNLSKVYDFIFEPLLVVNEKFRDLIEEKFYNFEVLYEKTSNDTGVAVTRTCIYLKKKYMNNKIVCLFLPSDHMIENEKEFRFSILNILKKTQISFHLNEIYLFGIKPTYPETGFGYITTNNEFYEKPTLEVAKLLIDENSFWNSGIFICKLDLIYELIFEYYPEYLKFIFSKLSDEKLPSFDKTILQKCGIIKMIKAKNWGWSDIGSWDSFFKMNEISNQINQNCLIQKCENISCLNFTNDEIYIIGCSDLIVVKKDEKLLILSKNDFQINNNELKKIVETKIL